MKKLILLSLCFCILGQTSSPVFAVTEESTIQDENGKYQVSKVKNINKEKYVRIRKKDLNEIRRQALLSRALLQRIRDLEKLYKDIRTIIETVNATIVFIKNFLNIDDVDISDSSSDGEFEHISGVIMSPGYVDFVVQTTDPESNFDQEDISDLEFDLYYNKNLFTIDHIDGDGIVETEYRTVSVSSKTNGAKDRLVIPLSDVLANETSFRIFLAPRNPDLIKVGDSTKLDIRYYKRAPKNEEGIRIPPIQYSFTEDSAQEITVAVK